MINRLLLSIAVFLLASPLVGLAAADCGTKLFDTAWDCSYTCAGGAPGTTCIEFGDYGVSSNFDMYIVGFDGDDGCTCGATGSVKKPKFDASSTFDCTETVFPSSTQGKVSGKKLTAQYWDYLGDSCLYSCTKLSSATCS
jgi:hypothetical protein